MFNDSALTRLAYWITERENIRKLRASGARKPWTQSPLLRDYRWCNVRRLDDAVSVQLFADWYGVWGEETFSEQLTAALLGRLINWPPSLMVISDGRPFAHEHIATMRKRLHARATLPVKMFTGAYVVPGTAGASKIDSVCDTVLEVSADWAAVLQFSMRATHTALCRYNNIGSFLAGQIVADLAHMPVGEPWQDKDTWAPIGPGSMRGMNRLLGHPKDAHIAQANFDVFLVHLMADLRPLIEGIWEDRKLQAMDIQNCLCEYDKYERLANGEGAVRARYPGMPTTSLFS